MIKAEQKIVWVTGAHGFIGRHLARKLAADGLWVAGLGHGTWPEKECAEWGVSAWLNGEITFNNLGYLLQRYGDPKAIYHLAGGSSVAAAIAQPREDFARSVFATAELLEWVRQNIPQTRVVAVSSAAVYGGGHPGPICEDGILNPYSPYGHHKRMMEDLCRSYGASFGLNSAIPRLFSVYGAGLKKQLLWDLCGKLATGIDKIELGGTGSETRDWVHVEDVVKAVAACAALADTSVPTINIGSGVALTVREVAERVANIWASRGRARPSIIFTQQRRAGDPFNLVADPTRLRNSLPPLEYSIDAGFGLYVEWYKILSKELG
jgi:UDP-glucose 4-epimerase